VTRRGAVHKVRGRAGAADAIGPACLEPTLAPA
jgi:hypothetical protein